MFCLFKSNTYFGIPPEQGDSDLVSTMLKIHAIISKKEKKTKKTRSTQVF